ncbi:MAG: TerB family tellurite resistance protein [Pseudomonadota bacterium]
MHIILGVLGAIVTILILVNRLSDAGIDIGWLNPFAWQRRRAWRKKYEGNPIFSLDSPLEVAALLATTVAKIDGDISREEKEILLSLFQSEFGKSETEASDLLLSSIYIFGNGEEAKAKPEKILKRSLDKFSEDQARSVMGLLNAIKSMDTANADLKENYVAKVAKVFDQQFNTHGKW